MNRSDRDPRDAREPRAPLAPPEPALAQEIALLREHGYVVLAHLHRGGANRTSRARLALSNQYCQPWARQQENYTLAVPPDQVRALSLSPRVRALLGYSIHPPFMGHVGGLHPGRLIDSEKEPERE